MSPLRARGAAAVLVAAAALRLIAILASARLTGDVLRYHKVAEALLGGEWNPYRLPRLYPYPPVWAAFEALAGALERWTGIGFPILVKLPILAAELGIVALLFAWGGRAGRAAAWLYALHPVSLLVSGVHGQFDALMLFAVLLALFWQEQGRQDRAALALAAAIALKSFPVLLLPLLLEGADRRRALRTLALATLPVAALLAPFALADLPALRRELLGYSGVADFGWIALARGVPWLRTDLLPRGEARFWGALVPVAKLLFLAGYAAFMVLLARGRLRLEPQRAALAVFLGFQVLYGALSAQYLLWVVPLAAREPDRRFAAYSAAATLALLGFYAFLQPGILPGQALEPWAARLAGRAWLLGVLAVLAASLAWLASLLRAGLPPRQP